MRMPDKQHVCVAGRQLSCVFKLHPQTARRVYAAPVSTWFLHKHSNWTPHERFYVTYLTHEIVAVAPMAYVNCGIQTGNPGGGGFEPNMSE